jgi:DNA-binding transcriptional LysR family regulator
MNIQQLKIFISVAATGSFSRTATLTESTQSSVSKAVAQLESELGARLFERTGRGVTMNTAGRALLGRAEALTRDADSLADLIADITGKTAGTVKFAIQPSVSWPLVHELVRHTHQHHPGIRLQISEGTTHQIEEWLADGRVDLGVLSKAPTSELAESWPLFSIPLLLVSRGTGTAEPGATVSLAQLAQIPLVIPTAPNGGRLLLEEAARRAKLSLNIALEVNSNHLIKRLVAAGNLSMVATWPSVSAEIASGELRSRALYDPVIRQTFYLAIGGRRAPARSVRAVAGIVQQFSPLPDWQAITPS